MADDAVEVVGPDDEPEGGPDDARADADERDPAEEGQHRCEVLAAMCLAVTFAIMLRGYAVAGALASVAEPSLFGNSTWELIEVGAGASTLFPVRVEGVTALATLVLAYLLVVEIGPGSWIGTLGTRVLEAVMAVGGLLAVGGLIATVASVRHPGTFELLSSNPSQFGGEPDAATLTTILDRGGSALPIVAGAVCAGYVGWLASKAQVELRREPTVEDAAAA